MQKEALLVKAFTKDPDKGNPAGVILGAGELTLEQMGFIAHDLGFSESAFVSPSSNPAADYHVRFITATQQEVDLCGHATIATFHALQETGEIQFHEDQPVTKRQETRAGILPVTCYPDGLIVMQQKDPEFLAEVTERDTIAAILRISVAAIANFPLEIVSTGTPKLLIPLVNRQVLDSIDIEKDPTILDEISAFCKTSGARGFYPFTMDTINPKNDFHARQFNPLAGINEDPITGVAAGALGAYAQKHNIQPGQTQFVIEQGYKMGKPGEIMVDVANGVHVGGYAVIFDRKNYTFQSLPS